ncbi:MAG: pyridoxal-phosphate-dependent aminotransferase family protein, partial [Methanobacteriota archaeon]
TGGYKAVAVTHNETSTGMTNRLQEVARVAKEAGCLVIADCITSIGAIPCKVDAWGIDLAVVGSQKALGGPAGLAFVSVSEAARKAFRPDPPLYLNLAKHVDKLKDGQTPFTPAIPLFLATLEACRMIRDEGLAARHARIAKTAASARAATRALGLDLVPEKGHESDTVTCIRYPAGLTDAEIRNPLKSEFGIVTAGGQDELKGKVVRIGHMGQTRFTDLVGFFGALESVLLAAGHKFAPGSSLAALVKQP